MQFTLSTILASAVAMSLATLASASPILTAEPEAIVTPHSKPELIVPPKPATLLLTRLTNVLRNPRPSVTFDLLAKYADVSRSLSYSLDYFLASKPAPARIHSHFAPSSLSIAVSCFAHGLCRIVIALNYSLCFPPSLLLSGYFSLASISYIMYRLLRE
ncbi:hypothetical protein NMY22_g2589 [Coprinellus aureogranulatus]|nr:hypothetical protein NMY22_g2589 [Coprinellus aureogranulatus]